MRLAQSHVLCRSHRNGNIYAKQISKTLSQPISQSISILSNEHRYVNVHLIGKRSISDYMKKVAKAATITDFKELVSEMHRRRYNLIRFQIGGVLFGLFFLYLFYEKVVDWLSDQTTTVTTKSLGNNVSFVCIIYHLFV